MKNKQKLLKIIDEIQKRHEEEIRRLENGIGILYELKEQIEK